MLSASQSKFLTSLQVKKYRQKYRNFIVEGSKMVAELLTQTRVPVVAIYALEEWADANAGLLAPFLPLFQPVTPAELQKISALTTQQGVLAVAEMPPHTTAEASAASIFAPKELGKVFFLDGIRDPGNLGTILRIADWFGFSAVYCAPDCVDAFSPKVVQASMGAILRLPVLEMELAEVLAPTPARPVLGAMLDGENAFVAKIPGDAVLVVGSEGSGIRPEVEQFLTRRLTIPRAPGSRSESLNASVAAGILAGLAMANQ
jgi:TrmH family RNA methyltransferase